MQEQNTHLNTYFSSSVSLKEAIWSLTKGVSKLRKTDIVITLKSGNDKKFENVIALGR